MTRPFFQPKSSPISRPMKPRRSQSHIPNCASCCSKSSAADTQWKIPDMCVRGCSLASMWFNYKDERRLALGTIWCKVNLYFVTSRFILYRILCIWHLHVHGDQITMHISMYILCCSGKIVYILLRCQSLCIFGRVRWMRLSGVSCSLFDPIVWGLPVTMVSFKSLSLKTFSADTQWKIPDMCVRGCSLASMWFNYKDERRLALGTIWCKVNLYFVTSRFILYRILCIWHLHVHGDQITFFFPSNAFMAFARSLHTFNCSKKMNCELCKAVYTSIASKALVMDQYTVQWAVPSK